MKLAAGSQLWRFGTLPYRYVLKAMGAKRAFNLANDILHGRAKVCLVGRLDPDFKIVLAGLDELDRLKARRYNWDTARKAWWIEVDETQFPEEEDWLRGLGLNGFIAKPVDATRRHL